MPGKRVDNVRFQRVKPVNMLVYRTVILLRKPILRFFHVEAINDEDIPRRGPAILLANHVTLFDPIWLYAIANRPMYFVTSEDLFRKRFLGVLIRWLGCFPKRKGVKDMSAVRNIIRLLRSGSMIGLFPEGVRSWDGLNRPMEPAIAGLILKMKVPVIACRFEGGYLSLPRWANKLRKIPVRGVIKRIYDGDSIPGNIDQIINDVSGFIQNRDYSLELDDSRYNGGGLARDITKLIYRCPYCGTFEGLQICTPLRLNRVECSSCFSAWAVTPSCRLVPLDEGGQPDGNASTLAEVHRQIEAMPVAPIRNTGRPKLAEGEALFLKSRPHILKREEDFPRVSPLSVGRIFLTNRRLIFRNRYRLILDAPLDQIHSLSTEAGNRFNFGYAGKLYHISIRTESILKWHEMILRLKRAGRDNQWAAAEDHTVTGRNASGVALDSPI